MRGLPRQRLQCDEILAFVGAKDKNIPAERAGEDGIGSDWTGSAIYAETKEPSSSKAVGLTGRRVAGYDA